MFQPTVKVFDSLTEISDYASQEILKVIADRKDAAQPASIALSGGTTPKKLYEELHSLHLETMRDRSKVKFLLGDERLVSPGDAQSNYHMAYDALLRDVPPSSVLRFDPTVALETSTDATTGEEAAWQAAAAYESTLCSGLPVHEVDVNGTSVQVPFIDIVLLGFGADGHTASVFPNSPAAHAETKAVAVSFPSPTMNPKVWRVTLTPLAIKEAAHVIVLACGKDKHWVLEGVLSETPSGETPVSRFLRECKGHVTFVVDNEAAGDIQGTH